MKTNKKMYFVDRKRTTGRNLTPIRSDASIAIGSCTTFGKYRITVRLSAHFKTFEHLLTRIDKVSDVISA